MLKKNILFILIASFHCIALFSQETHFTWEGTIREKDAANSVPYAHIRVFSDNRVFLFSADHNGRATIIYYRPTEHDSILITSIGYQPRKLSRHELQTMNEIQLEEEILSLSDVVITPSRRRRVRTMKLGNTNTFALGATNEQFEYQVVLFIPHDHQAGKILQIRYYMGGVVVNMSDRTNTKNHYPFRVRLYEKDTINNTVGKNLLNDALIVSQNKNNWLEVDISEYNIMMPKNGVFVGFEILPAEYYLENNIISNRLVEDKHGKKWLNTVTFGVTKNSQKNSFKHFSYNPFTKRWSLSTKLSSGINYLINIEVERIE